MHFDTIIIGGGLSGLVTGLRLQRSGRKCAIISTGQNAMHFSSGAFGLLSRLPDGTPVAEPLEGMKGLPQDHPYSKIGAQKMKEYMFEVKPLFASCGVTLEGDELHNSYMITPSGSCKSVWLALADVTLLKEKHQKIGNKALIINIKGYLDFNTSFIAEGLESAGTECRIEALELPRLERLRSNPSEMRSVNIARVMEDPETVAAVARAVCARLDGEDTVVLPSVFGLRSAAALTTLRESIPVNSVFVGTMPPSVPGIRSQALLKKSFEAAGGTFLNGDEAIDASIEDNKVKSLRTKNLGKLKLTANNYVLASGSFFSKGLWSTPDSVSEPLFGLDVDAAPSRMDWYDRDFFAAQNYIGYGVKTDSSFHPLRGGEPVQNLYAAGSVLGNCNSVSLGCGAGVAIMTALAVSDNIAGE